MSMELVLHGLPQTANDAARMLLPAWNSFHHIYLADIFAAIERRDDWTAKEKSQARRHYAAGLVQLCDPA